MLIARRLAPVASQISHQVPKAFNITLAQRCFATEQPSQQNGSQQNGSQHNGSQQNGKQTAQQNGKQAEPSQPTSSTSEATNSKETTTTSAEQKLQDEIQQLKARAEEYKQELAYALAERENQRKIAKADMEKTKAYGIQSFAASLIDVADNLSMALTSIPAAELEKGNVYLKNLYVGVEMTEKELAKVFTAQGIKKFDPLGEKFNPNNQQAVFEVEDPAKTPGVVAHVVKSGYMIKDRVLRPATVGVVKASASSPQSASN